MKKNTSVWQIVEMNKEKLTENDSDTSSKQSPSRNKRVRFKSDPEAKVIPVPSRADYFDISHHIWYSKNELTASANQAAFTVRETMNKNPSLTLESAMCFLYQSTEMFSSRIRLLIVNNDAISAAETRNHITNAQRANIWTVQCCSYDTASKVLERGNICFDMVLIDCDVTKGELCLAKDLLHAFRQQGQHRLMLGLSLLGKSNNSQEAVPSSSSSSLSFTDFQVDFIFAYTPASPHSTEQLQLRNLLALRHLRECPSGVQYLHSSFPSCSNNWDSYIQMSLFSYPIGYKIIMNNLPQY